MILNIEMKNNKLNNFILKSKKKFGERFDYSRVSYVDSDTIIELVEKSTNTIFKISPKNHLRNKNGLPNNLISKGFSKEDFIERLKEATDGTIELVGEYVTGKLKTKFRCLRHSIEYNQLPQAILTGFKGCPCCTKENLLNRKSKFNKKDPIQVSEFKDYIINSDKTLEEIGKIFNISGHRAGVLVKELNLTRRDFIKERKNYLENCIKKGMSISEIAEESGTTIQAVFYKLNKYNIDYSSIKRNKYFGENIVNEWLRNYKDQLGLKDIIVGLKVNSLHGRTGKGIIVDFSFKYSNRTYWVEYNGEQHYKPIKFFGGEENLYLQKNRDEEERKYCKDNNIILIEIPYILNTRELIYKFLKNVIIDGKNQNDILNYKEL